MRHGKAFVQESVGTLEYWLFFITNRGPTPSREGATGAFACDEIAGETGGENFPVYTHDEAGTIFIPRSK